MTRTKSLKGPCQQCGGRLEFPAELIGTHITCPHCGNTTELMLAPAPAESALPRRAILWTAIAVVILGLGLTGALVALKRAQRWAARQKEAASSRSAPGSGTILATNLTAEQDAAVKAGFEISAITFEQTAGSSLLYAVGALTNAAPRQRFGIKLQLDLLDSAGQKVGAATDYVALLEPGGTWQFKALVVEPKAVSAKLSGIKEDQ